MTTRVLVFASDQHCGSTLGLLHPDGVQTDDGQWIQPSRLQGFLWDKHAQFVADVRAIIESEPDASVHYFNVGDLTDGWHHGTHQVISVDEGVHIEAATQALEKGILTLPFDTVHMIRGTPAHVKKAAGLEKAVANRLNAHGHPIVRDTLRDTFLWQFVFCEFDGLTLDVRHHGRSGGREHTRKSYAALYAQDIWQTHIADGRTPPALAIRAHKHKFMDSGPDHRGITRVVGLPCWQFGSEWVASKSIESLPDFGGVVVVVRNGDFYVKPLLYQPDPEPQAVWRPE